MAALQPAHERIAVLTEALGLTDDPEDAAEMESVHVRIALGEALIESGDRDGAREQLRTALDHAQRGSARRSAERAHHLLVAAGARPRRRERVGMAALTRHERQVVELAATGRTNREIAEELYVTQRTVEMHLTKAFRKLGVARRADLPEAVRADQDVDGTPSP